MGRVSKLLSSLLLTLILSITLISCTQRNQYDELNDEIIVLFQQGQYLEAEKLAKEALTIAKETFGKDHPTVASSLDMLAMIYYTERKYGQAEPLYKETLAIREKTLGSDHPDVVSVLANMVELYKTIGKSDEAKKLTERIEGIRSNQ